MNLLDLALQLAFLEELVRNPASRIVEDSFSLDPGAERTIIELNGTGRIDEVLIISSSQDFSVKVIVDGNEVWNKDYGSASSITDELMFLAVFTRVQDGKYVYHLADINFRSSVKIAVRNTGSSEITFDNIVIKYRLL